MTRTYTLPLNRVEGDLEIRVEVEDNRIVDAWSAGTLYRGFENMLRGRAAMDSLVITPRICGICTTTHLLAAAKCLDMIAGVTPPDNALRLRNVALLAEHMQSDLRQAVLMFIVDFAHPAYRGHPLYPEAAARYQPVAGSSCLEVIRETKKIIEVIAVVGGQWPHASFMVPGGVTYMPNRAELLQCRSLVKHFRGWYERFVLGCSLERWAKIGSAAELEQWLQEDERHAKSEIGFFLRLGRALGLDRLGRGHGNFISYGMADLPDTTAVAPLGPGRTVLPAGFARGTHVEPLDQNVIGESVAHSHYLPYEGSRHPLAGETRPGMPGGEGGRYSWSKAPRYRGLPAEAGPLAEAVVAGLPLFVDLVRPSGPNVLVRQLARFARPALLIPLVEAWLDELIAHHGEPHIAPPGDRFEGEGYGLIEAARGALGHWARVERGRIAHYQVVTPTAWNGSPRDELDVRGAWEEALVGTPLADPGNPLAAGHVIRSFDPCLVCTVHAIERSGAGGRFRLGV